MTRRSPQGSHPLLALALLAGALGGCTPQRSSAHPAERYHPAAFHPEDFPDIPLLPLTGYEFDPNAEQLAVSLAGGTVRRFEVTMVRRPNATPDLPEAVLNRFAQDLRPWGWVREEPGRWHKGQERLFIQAGRSERITTVRIHLRPDSEDTSLAR